MIAEFFLTIFHTQLLVHNPGTDRPGPVWTDEHVAQGFAWSDGVVSFGVPDHDGQCLVIVELADGFAVSEATLWAVQTPFHVTTASTIIGTIGDDRSVSVPRGSYNLVFEAQKAQSRDLAYVLRLHFVPAGAPDFAIIKQGDELGTDEVIRRDADRA